MVRKLAGGWVCLTWGLWFGAMGALFLFVTRLFAVDHTLAVKTAPHLFMAFDRYQTVLAAASLAGAAAWRMAGKNAHVTAIFCLLAVATIAAVVGTNCFLHPMLALWAQGKSNTPEFWRLHGESMGLFSMQMIVLFIVGLVLPWALWSHGQERERGV